MYLVEAHLEVDVKPEVAFDTLLDHDSWREWMPRSFEPVGPSVGKLRVGVVTKVRIDRLPFPSPLTVTVAERPRALTWCGGKRGVLYAEHTFRFEHSGDGTRMISSELWSGWLAQLLKPLLSRGASRVGRAQLEGLKKGALTRASKSKPS